MRTRKLTRTVALLASLMMFAAACGGDDDGGGTADPTSTAGGGGDDVAALRDAGTVRVGIKYDQPLFGVNAPGGVVGFDAEIAKIVVEAIFQDGDPDSHIQFIEAVSANREPFLQNNQVDMVVATYTINATRDEVIDFAGPYYVAGQDIMVPKGNPLGITGVDDLNTPDITTCSVDGSN
jgi:glutamate transport system substrate-binding protein